MGVVLPTIREISRSIHAGTDAGITPVANHVPGRWLPLAPTHSWGFGEMITAPGCKDRGMPSKVILAGLVLALPASIAHASDRTTILGYICATYESARQVALEQGWERPQTMPGDCRSLFRRGFEDRLAVISEIMEIFPIGDGRWVETGKVRGNAVGTGYSAGMSRQLLLF